MFNNRNRRPVIKRNRLMEKNGQLNLEAEDFPNHKMFMDIFNTIIELRWRYVFYVCKFWIISDFYFFSEN